MSMGIEPNKCSGGKYEFSNHFCFYAALCNVLSFFFVLFFHLYLFPPGANLKAAGWKKDLARVDDPLHF